LGKRTLKISSKNSKKTPSPFEMPTSIRLGNAGEVAEKVGMRALKSAHKPLPEGECSEGSGI
jgi:hypothetical protein